MVSHRTSAQKLAVPQSQLNDIGSRTTLFGVSNKGRSKLSLWETDRTPKAGPPILIGKRVRKRVKEEKPQMESQLEDSMPEEN